LSLQDDEKVTELTKSILSLILQSGLTWEEVIASFSVASNTIVFVAANSNNENITDYAKTALDIFSKGLSAHSLIAGKTLH